MSGSHSRSRRFRFGVPVVAATVMLTAGVLGVSLLTPIAAPGPSIDQLLMAAAQHMDPGKLDAKQRPDGGRGVAFDGNRPVPGLTDPVVVGGKKQDAAPLPDTEQVCAAVPANFPETSLPGVKPGGQLCGTVRRKSIETIDSAPLFTHADGSRPGYKPVPKKAKGTPEPDPSASASPSASATASPSGTPSADPSGTGSASADPSASTSASGSTSPTTTPSTTPSASGTTSGTPSATVSPRLAVPASNRLQAALPMAPQPAPGGGYLSPNWIQQHPSSEPQEESGVAMAYDPVHNQVVLFGGYISSGSTSAQLNQTWTWSSGQWNHVTPAVSPPVRDRAAMAWDPVRGKIVLFGGHNATSYLGDTWTWDGTTWASLTTTGAPTARADAPLTWDPNANALLMFGGSYASGVLSDTWKLSGTTWTQVQANSASGAPAWRNGAGMAYDPNLNQTLLFGGVAATCATCAAGTYMGDTWKFTGTGWTPLTPSTSPSPRTMFGMVYDPGLGAILLVNGIGPVNGSPALLTDTWAWNGTTWVQAQSGISQAPAWVSPAIAATNNGQVVWQIGSSTDVGETWTYDTGVPILSVASTGATGAGGVYFMGDTAQIQITATNLSTQQITPSLVSNLGNDLIAKGSQFFWNSTTNPLPTCAQSPTGACSNDNNLSALFSTVPLAPNATNVLGNFVAQVVGNTRGCKLVSIPILATSAEGGSRSTYTSITVCGGGLGAEKWWTYDTTQLGVGGTASVNAANGNLLLKQTDSTPIQSHGQLAFELGRAYNSQDNLNRPGPLGAGWQWDMSATGDAASPGLMAGGLIVPSVQSLLDQPLSMTYVDRDGTRHVFTSRSVMGTVGPINVVAGVAPNLHLSIVNGHAICMNVAYTAPPGTNMSMYRYLDVTGDCGNPQGSSKVLGWAVVKPNRERYDYDLQGKLASVTDASGNQIKFDYDPANGRLVAISSNRCAYSYNPLDTSTHACPHYSFPAPTTAVYGGVTYNRTDVIDTAGRTTTYLVSQGDLSNPKELKQVWNPDNPFSPDGTPSIAYEYAPAGGQCPDTYIPAGTPAPITTGALCSVTDPAGGKTTFGYAKATLGPDRVQSVTDRRANATGGKTSTAGSKTVFSYTDFPLNAATITVTADTASPATQGTNLSGCQDNAACQRNNYTGIDYYGRVGEVDQGTPLSGTNGSWKRQEAFFWDGDIVVNGMSYGCNGPSTVLDHELCETITRTVPSGTQFTPIVRDVTPQNVASNDQVAVYHYNELGMPTLAARLIDPTLGLINNNLATTTYGNHVQYVESDNTVHLFNDVVGGISQIFYDSDANPASYSKAVTGDSPLAYYRFDNLSGSTAVDVTDTPQNLAEDDGTVLGQPGAIASSSNTYGNAAVGEPGNNKWAGIADHLTGFASGTGASSAFTVESWIKTTNNNTDYTLCAPCNGTGVVVGRYNGKPWIYLLGTGAGQVINRVAEDVNVTDGNWHQVAFTYDGSGTANGANIYVDGVKVASPTTYNDTLGANPFRTDGTIAKFGYNAGATGPDGTGLDEVSLYTTALAGTKLKAHYDAIAKVSRIDDATLYAFGDQTQMLTPRGNAATKWGDYLTTYRHDAPDTTQAFTLPNQTTNGSTVCSGAVQNTGLVCEVDTPASAGVAAGVCKNPTVPGGGAAGGGPTSSGYTFTCTRAVYDDRGQKSKSWSAKANSDGVDAPTEYFYYGDTDSCDTNNTNCDLSGSVSAGGWLKAVEDPDNKFVAYAYDRSGNTARTWDRDATSGKQIGDAWTNAAAPPSTKFTESTYTNPVTSNVLSVSAYDTEILTPNGTVWGSGDNAAGQLGDGTTTNRPTPTQALGGLHDVVQIAQSSLGGFNSAKSSYALTGSGDLYGWGQLTGTTKPTLVNTPASGLPKFASISVGTAHVLALDRTGTLWAWGSSSFGQVGDGSTSGSVAPKKIMSGVATFSAGGYHSTAITTDGRLWAWGWNSTGQIGNNSTANVTSPTLVPGMTKVASVSAGVQSTYAIKANGTVWAWGRNNDGDLGISSTTTQFNTPQPLTTLGVAPNTESAFGRFRQIAAGVWGAAAVLTDGSVWAWGLNNSGQLGGATGSSNAPVKISGLTNQVAISGGWATYLSANEAGEVRIWGQTSSGQNGNANPPAQVLPQLLQPEFQVSPFSFPWRYATSSRNQLGDRSSVTVDADGMPTVSRTARGNAVFSTTYDTFSSYDAGNLVTSVQTPVERGGANGALPDGDADSIAAPSTFGYDVFGNRTSSVDPRKNATVTVYDEVNRATAVKTTRSATVAPTSDVCSASASGAPWGAAQQGHMVCTTSTTYDGNDRTVSVTDANTNTATTTYDGLGRKLTQTVPRNDNFRYTTLTSVWVYDRDGNVTDACPPRQFDGNREWKTTAAGSCPADAAYGTHRVFDNAGRVSATRTYRATSDTAADTLTATTAYDADGNVIASTDANGHTTTASYDLQGRKQAMTVPRGPGVAFTTTWTYSPSGDVTSVNAPSANNYGDGADGALTVDGSTNPQSNPAKIPAGARYTTVTLINGGWITADSGMGLTFTATGAVTVCATCGITMAGAGQNGGAGSAQLLGNSPGSPGDVVGGNGGGAGTGSVSGGGGGGGGHNGPGTPGVGGALTQGNGGAGGLTSGTNDFSDVGSNYALGSGGGGGGAGQGTNAVASSAGGKGGGFIHITAPTITVNGTVTAAGANGAYSANVNGGSGGGAGGGIWLTSDTVTLANANVLNVAGGTGGVTNSSGGNGGAGAPGYLRIDGTVSGNNAPTGTVRRSTGMVTAYSYDAAHRVIDTVRGFQGSLSPVNLAGQIPDGAGQVNSRTRVGYDAEGHQIIGINPRAFTDANSLIAPNLAFSSRADFDADGRTVLTYAPRYDTTANPDVSSGGDGGTSGLDQQTAQCPTGADPSLAPGYGSYANTVGVCLARTTYDVNGNVARRYLASSTGSDNRYQEVTYTDDNLPASVTTANPQGSGRVTAQTTVYDGVGKVVTTTDANGRTDVTKYTDDGLVKETDGQIVGSTTTHVTKVNYDANGNEIITTLPNSSAPGGYAAGTYSGGSYPAGNYAPTDYRVINGWTSDGLKKQVSAPGLGTRPDIVGTSNITNYEFDNVGNPTKVFSPSAMAADVTNPSGQESRNTYTDDNLVLTSVNPVTASSSRLTKYTYTPSGQKASSEVGTCASASTAACAGFQSGALLRYTYAPTGVNVTQIGRNVDPTDDPGFAAQASISTVYDQAGNPTKVTASDSSTTVTAGYYLDGLPRTASDGSNTNTYAYDGNGSLSVRTDQSGSTGVTGGGLKKTSFSYNDAGVPAFGLSDVTNNTRSEWGYDVGGRPVLRTDRSGASVLRTVSQVFNADDTVASLTSANGSAVLAKNEYTYDNQGQILTQKSTMAGSATYTDRFTYDPGGNVTSWGNESVPSVAYEWDHDSNRVKAGGTPASFNADNTIKTAGSGATATAFTYGNAGELRNTKVGSTTCSANTYDAFMRTGAQETMTGAGCGAQATKSVNSYDGLDRVTKTVRTGTQAGTTLSSYDGLSSSLVGQTSAMTGNGSTPTVLYALNPNGAPVGFTQTPSGGGSASYSWLNKDARGNVVSLSDVGGTSVSCAVEYDPFGSPVAPGVVMAVPPLGNGVCKNALGSSASTGNALWYGAGARSAAGTYQLGSRTYNPSLASFTTPDTYRVGTPAKDLSVGTDPLTANTYTYVNGNPLNASDPSGHGSECPSVALSEWLGCKNKPVKPPKKTPYTSILDGLVQPMPHKQRDPYADLYNVSVTYDPTGRAHYAMVADPKVLARGEWPLGVPELIGSVCGETRLGLDSGPSAWFIRCADTGPKDVTDALADLATHDDDIKPLLQKGMKVADLIHAYHEGLLGSIASLSQSPVEQAGLLKAAKKLERLGKGLKLLDFALSAYSNLSDENDTLTEGLLKTGGEAGSAAIAGYVGSLLTCAEGGPVGIPCALGTTVFAIAGEQGFDSMLDSGYDVGGDTPPTPAPRTPCRPAVAGTGEPYCA